MKRVEQPPPDTRTSARRYALRLGSAMVLATALFGVSPASVAVAHSADRTDLYDDCWLGHRDACKGDKGDKGDKGEPGPPGPPGPCVSIAKDNRGQRQFTGVIGPDSDISVGARNLQAAPGPNPGPYTWTDLSDNPNAPQNACDIGVNVQGNTLNIQVITTDGTVVETFCNVPGQQLVCEAPWTPVVPQPPE